MLTITVPAQELWDDVYNEFVSIKEQELRLEHSLVSISKWESKWKVRFFEPNYNKTTEQVIDYIRCMTLTQNVDPKVYYNLSSENIKKIEEYIADPMTATTFGDDTRNGNGRVNGRLISSELVYYWMLSFGIPVEFQKWHFNRLTTLIRVCSAENEPEKKMGNHEIMARHAELNARRRAEAAKRRG